LGGQRRRGQKQNEQKHHCFPRKVSR
jgi:hypothetical protein